MGSLHARGRGGGIIFVVVAAAAMSIQEPEHESVGFNRGPPPVYSGTEPLKVVYEEESSEMNEKSPLLSNSTTSLSNKYVDISACSLCLVLVGARRLGIVSTAIPKTCCLLS